jgi:preprotein translocase subunit YajC
MELWILGSIILLIVFALYIAYWLYIDERKKNKEKIDELAEEIKYLKKHNERVEAEKYKNWGDDIVTTGPYSMTLKEPAKQCVFSKWEINDKGSPGHPGFCIVYGKGNAEKVLKALNYSYINNS